MAFAQTLAWTPPLSAQVPTPEAHFGFRMGADRQLAAAADIEAYFETVARQSDRVRAIEIGPTTEGHRTIGAIISAPENILNLKDIRDANQRLADPRLLSADAAREVTRSHKAIVAIGAGIHADE